MQEMTARYHYTWPGKPLVAVLAAFGAALFACAAYVVEDALFVRLVLGFFAVVVMMIAMGAAIKTSITVDVGGQVAVIKTLVGVPFSCTRFQSGEVLRVALDRQMSAGSPKSSGMGSNASTPRFRIDLVHARGTCVVEASAGHLEAQAERWASALNCPLEKTGDWR